MGAAAQVDPVALAVHLQGLVSRDGVDQLDLEPFTALGEEAFGVVAAPLLLGEGAVACHDLAHALLDRREVVGREGRVAEEVVIEPVLDHRADGHLRAGKKVLHGFGQHVGGVVADQRQGARVVAGKELDPRVGVDRVGEVDHDPVARDRHGALGERRGDGFRDL